MGDKKKDFEKQTIDQVFTTLFVGHQYGISQAELQHLDRYFGIWKGAGALEACAYAAMVDCMLFYAKKDEAIAFKIFATYPVSYLRAQEILEEVYKMSVRIGVGVYTHQNYIRKFKRFLSSKSLVLKTVYFRDEGLIWGHTPFLKKEHTLEKAVIFIQKHLAKREPVAFLTTSLRGRKTAIGINHWVTITDIMVINKKNYQITCATWGKSLKINLADIWDNHDSLTETVLIAQKITTS